MVRWRRLSGTKIDLVTIRTDANGAVSGRFKVPATPGGPGQQVLFVQGGIALSLPFEIAPRIKVTPDPAERGQIVDISLRGFARNETIRIRWRRNGAWVLIGTVTASNTGSANLRLPAPWWALDGEHAVRADGTAFRAQTNTVTISGGPEVDAADLKGPTASATATASPTITPEPGATEIVTPEATASVTATVIATSEPAPDVTAVTTVPSGSISATPELQASPNPEYPAG